MEPCQHAPRNVQRKRTKGWRMPEGAVYVGRPTKWGNPYVLDAALDWDGLHVGHALPETVYCREHAVDLYRDWVHGHLVPRTGFGPFPRHRLAFARLAELRGKDLACWCPLDQPCHADVLLELANPTS